MRTLVTTFFSGASPERVAEHLPAVAVVGREAAVRPEALSALADERSARINRFLWEGGFFLAVLLGGMAVLTRTIRHDAELRRRQQNFLAAVSHEFKSPLASIQLASETLVLRSRESDTQRLGRRILEDCERLLAHGGQPARRDSARGRSPTVRPDRLALRGAAETAVAEIAERARLSSVTIALEVPEDLKLTIDPGVLEHRAA